MLFQSEQIWDAILATTNAEESLHHVFYSGAGLDYELMDGFYGLFALSKYFLGQYQQTKGM